MSDDRVSSIEALLVAAEQAHGEYETTQLNGVYDRQWPSWYAAHAVDGGIAGLIGHPVTAGELGTFLATTYAEFAALEPKPAEAWYAFVARRIASEL
jgi:hypothetical protein